MVSYDNEDAIVVTEPTEIEVAPDEGTAEGSRGVSGPIINNAGGTSETPSNLVAEGNKPELSPNPAGFGFTKQRTVDELPEQGEPNTVYLLNVYNNGTHIGYRIFKWTPSDGYTQFGATPDLKLEKGAQEQKAIEVNAPKQAPEKVFAGEVVFLQEPTIKGKKLSDYIDSVGGVTEAELQAAVAALTAQINTKQDALTTTSVPEGTATRLIGFDSQGHPVNSPLPEGTVVVDTELDDQSTNPVQNKVVTEKFNEVDEGLETKANVDGNYPTMTVGVADNLTPYDESAGDDQDEPFSLQATGTGNGTQPDFSTGSIALMKEKQGNTVVVNQFAKTLNATNYAGSGASASFADGVATFTATQQYGKLSSMSDAFNMINGHKYLAFVEHKGTVTSFNTYFSSGQYISNFIVNATHSSFTPIASVFTYNQASGTTTLHFQDNRASDWTEQQIKNFALIDLTQWFNGDIPQDLLDNPENFFRYYQGSLAYNEGELVNADGRYIKCIGMNQWDEETEIGALQSDGTVNTSASSRLTTSFIKVIPNATYYLQPLASNVGFAQGRYAYYDANKNLVEYNGDGYTSHLVTIPPNVHYVRITLNSAYGTTYNHDCSVNLYYEDEPRCLTYEPYQVLTNNDTGTEVLRSVLDLRDSKTPDGTITRRVGIVDLGSLSYNRILIGSNYYFRSPTNLQGSINYKENTNKIECAIYNRINYGSQITEDNFPNMSICGSIEGGGGGYFYVRNDTYTTADDFKSAMSGVYLFYELAEPTTEQGTPFSENLTIDDFGSMDFSGTNGVPQGALIFYPVDYKAFIDTLYDYANGTPSNIALKSELLAQKDTTRLTQTLVLTGAESEEWSISGSYSSVKRFNLIGTFTRYFDTEHPRGIGTATSSGLTINWIQDSVFSNITTLSACFYGGTGATVPQLILLIPNSENVSTVEELRTWLASHNITIEYEYSKYKLVATLLNGVVTYAWEKD